MTGRFEEYRAAIAPDGGEKLGWNMYGRGVERVGVDAAIQEAAARDRRP